MLGAMLPEATLAATLVTAVVLLVSGVAKALDREPLASWEAMGVPEGLRRPGLARAHAWAEVALGVLLLALPAPWSTGVAVLVVLLFVAYLVLVARLVRRGEEVSCHCFGALGSGTVDRGTVVRNVVLLLVAGLAVLDLAVQGWAAPRLGEQAGWVLALAATAVVAVLVVRGSSPSVGEVDQEELEDYLRLPIPDVPVVDEPGGEQRSLREVAAGQAMLLLLLSSGCGSCRQVTARLPEWVEALPGLSVRVVSGIPHAQTVQFEPQWDGLVLYEPQASVGQVFGLMGRPAAVLLGADGLLAGGPVKGYHAIAQFVDDIRAELDDAAR
jgi:hypothetical protein